MPKFYAKGSVLEIKDHKITGAVASTGSMDRDNEVLEPSGWILDNFRKAPRLLWSHNAYELPIGRITNIWVDGTDGGLKFDAEFAAKENDFAAKVEKLVKGGFLNTFSVGFRALERDGSKFLKQELLEISIVNVPANPEARLSFDYKSFEDDVKKFELENQKKEEPKEEKSPACRMEDESRNECVARKIPEIKKDRPELTQEQVVGMAEGICDKLCAKKDGDITIKDGRIISEKNRLILKNALDVLKQAKSALQELLDVSDTTPKGATKVDRKTKKDFRILRVLQQIDKAVEIAIHETKK